MNFDLRIPIGLIFSIFGLILVGTGLLGPQDLYKQSLGLNINLWWGLVQFVFGVSMLFFGMRGRKAPAQRAEENPSE